MNRKRAYLISLLGISFLAVLFFLRLSILGLSQKPFIDELRSDFKSKIPAYDPTASLFEFVANRSWIHTSGKSPFVEGGMWKFYGDGGFEYSAISDYVFNLEGTWKLIDFGNKQGLIYLDYVTTIYEGNEDISVRRKEVVFIEANNKHLNFNFKPFWGEELSTTETNPAAVIIDSTYIQKDFPPYSWLLEKKWIKDNDENKDFNPHELTFYDNGTFFANFIRDTPCNFNGNWSLYELKPGRVEIRLSAPNAECDLRGYKGFSWGGGYYFSITETNLISEHSDAYNYHAE